VVKNLVVLILLSLSTVAVAAGPKVITQKDRRFDHKAHDAALKELESIRDRAALPALAKAAKAEKYLQGRLHYLTAIKEIGGPEAANILIKFAVESRITACAEMLSEMPEGKGATPQLIRYLRSEKHQQAAIDLLPRLKFLQYQSGQLPEPLLFQALVDSLVTKDFVYAEGWTYTWSRSRGSHFGPHGAGFDFESRLVQEWGIVKQTVPKEQPITKEILKGYSSQDYGYDQGAWERWYRDQRRTSNRK